MLIYQLVIVGAVEAVKRDGSGFLQSVTNAAVYAAGDAAQVGPPLTPASSHDAKVVASNLLEGNHRKPDYSGVPSVVTIPPLASVGLTEAAVRRQGQKFRIKSQTASDWFTARRAAEPTYGFKVLVDEDRIGCSAHIFWGRMSTR